MRQRHLLLLCATLAGIPLPVANAVGPPQALDTLAPIEFGFQFSHIGYSFSDGTSSAPTNVQWAGLGWNERFSEHVQLGIHAGNTFLTQTQNPLTAGLQLVGYHAGLCLVLELNPRASVVRYFVDFSLTQQSAAHESSTQSLEFDWVDSRAGFWIWVYPSDSVQFMAGSRYGKTSGTLLASGAVNSSTDFQVRENGTALGVNFNDGKRGSVGYLARYGVDRGGLLYFKRQF